MGPIFVECVPRPGHVTRLAIVASIVTAFAFALAPSRTAASQIAPSMQESTSVQSPLRGPHRCGVRKLAR